jgi:hypothetical protein
MPQKFDLLPNNQLALDYYLEYVSLGGKKNREEYDKNNQIFFEETYDIFVFGDTWKHETREEALSAVIDKAGLSTKEYNLIFTSVDNVTAYT